MVHREFHRDCGPHTTVSQFEQWFKQNYGITEFPWSTSAEEMNVIQEKIQAFKEKKKIEILEKLEKNNLELISGNFENKKSELIIYCRKHGFHYKTKVANLQRAVIGISYCAEEISKTQTVYEKGLKRSAETLAKKASTEKLKYGRKIEERAKEFNHTLVKGSFESRLSMFTIFCSIHNETVTISYSNYMRNKRGLPCCGKST